MPKKYRVTLTVQEREELERVLSGPTRSSVMSCLGHSNATPLHPRSPGSSQPKMPASNSQASTRHLSSDKALVDYSAIPPKAGPEYPVFTAKVDDDGHAVAGIRLPQIEAPTAAFLGWNLRKSGFAEGALCGLTGSTIPLARSKAERTSDDRRMTLEERYPTHSDYVSAIRKAADRLVGDRILLPFDAERIVRQAEAAEIDRPRP